MVTRSSGFTLIELLVVVLFLNFISCWNNCLYWLSKYGKKKCIRKFNAANIFSTIRVLRINRNLLNNWDASSCSATDASDDEIEEDLFDGDDIIPDGLGFNICTFGSGATFTVVADDGADCQLMLRRNSSLDETQCQ